MDHNVSSNQNEIAKFEHDRTYQVKKVSNFVSDGQGNLIRDNGGTGQQPDGGFVYRRADGEFFNTTVNLAADATYTGEWFDHDGFGMIELFVKSDVPSADQGIVLEWTQDANVETPVVQAQEYFEFKEADVRIGYKDLHIRPRLDGFRVKYINGSLAQSNVLVTVVGRVNPEVGRENSGGAVITGSFEREVALGNVSNYRQNTKFGRNPSISTNNDPQDVWGGASDYTGFNATANDTIDVVSTDANDSGTLVSSGTVTTTSDTQLIDSTATFVTDGVAAGDIVLNDTRGTYGYITSVDSETAITVFRMQDSATGRYDNIVGNSYRIANASDTGAAVISLNRILNEDYGREGTKFVIMNGTTNVTTTVDAMRCSRAKVLLAGSSGGNEGTISGFQTNTTANVFIIITPNKNQTEICADTVPKDTIALIETVQIIATVSGGGSGSAVATLRVSKYRGAPFTAERVFDLASGGGPFTDEEIGGIPFSEGTDFKLRIDSVSANNTAVGGKIEYLEINEI